VPRRSGVGRRPDRGSGHPDGAVVVSERRLPGVVREVSWERQKHPRTHEPSDPRTIPGCVGKIHQTHRCACAAVQQEHVHPSLCFVVLAPSWPFDPPLAHHVRANIELLEKADSTSVALLKKGNRRGGYDSPPARFAPTTGHCGSRMAWFLRFRGAA